MSSTVDFARCPGHAPLAGQAMTRCECAEMSFDELAARMRAERLALGEVLRRTGCGRTCTACLPDLEEFLALGPEPAGRE